MDARLRCVAEGASPGARPDYPAALERAAPLPPGPQGELLATVEACARQGMAAMNPEVLGRRGGKAKILRSVIELVAVDVVDVLPPGETAADGLLDNPAVLVDPAAVDGDSAIAEPRRASGRHCILLI